MLRQAFQAKGRKYRGNGQYFWPVNRSIRLNPEDD
jgi:hypothetical protein